MNSNNPAPPRPLVTPKAKLARGIDRSQFRPEIASDPELVVKMTHMVFGEVGRQAPLPVKIIQLETAFNRAQARGQTLAHVLLSVKESPSDGYYAIENLLRSRRADAGGSRDVQEHCADCSDLKIENVPRFSITCTGVLETRNGMYFFNREKAIAGLTPDDEIACWGASILPNDKGSWPMRGKSIEQILAVCPKGKTCQIAGVLKNLTHGQR